MQPPSVHVFTQDQQKKFHMDIGRPTFKNLCDLHPKMFIYSDINLLSRYFLNKNVLNKYKPYLSKCSNLNLVIILRRRTALTKIGIHSFNVHIATQS